MSLPRELRRAKGPQGRARRRRLDVASWLARPFAVRLHGVAFLSACMLCGCSKYVAVEGIVTLDGEPMNGATVVFLPVDDSGGAKMAQTFTDPGGRFELYSVRRSGALPGKYKVAVTRKVLPPGVPPAKDDSMGEAVRVNTRKVESIPPKYTTEDTTPLLIEVPDGGATDLVIELAKNP